MSYQGGFVHRPRLFPRSSPSLGQHGVNDPAVVFARLTHHITCCHNSLDQARQTAPTRQNPVGEFSHFESAPSHFQPEEDVIPVKRDNTRSGHFMVYLLDQPCPRQATASPKPLYVFH